MGFFAVNKCEISRVEAYGGGKRHILARYYDDVLGRWVGETFEGWNDAAFDAAVAFCRKAFLQLEM